MQSASHEMNPEKHLNIKPNGNFVGLEIAVWSFIAIFFQLSCQRWFCCDVRPLVFEQTLPLVASLAGLGSGLANKNGHPVIFFPSALFLVVLSIKLAEMSGLTNQRSAAEGSFDWHVPSSAEEGTLPLVFVQFAGLIVLLFLNFATSFCIGCRLGALLSKMDALRGYILNAFASLVGVFFAFCLGTVAPQPAISISLVALPTIYILVCKEFKILTRVLCSAPALLIPFLFLFPNQSGDQKPTYPQNFTNHYGATETIWSPYQRLDVNKFFDGNPPSVQETTAPPPTGWVIRLNRIVDQMMFDPEISVDNLPPDLTKACADSRRLDAMGFLFGTAENVLILGSGLGQGLPSAKENGARTIDLVEIDPVLQSMSRQINRQAAQGLSVNYVCDDARHFLETTNKKYDLILMSNLYSQASNLLDAKSRLDTFCYTREAFKKAKDRLNHGGKLVIAYPVIYPWIGERVFRTLEFASGRPPKVFQQSFYRASKIPTLFVMTESPEQIPITRSPNWSEIKVIPKSNTPVLTDDWPYLNVLGTMLDLHTRLLFAFFMICSFIGARNLIFVESARENLSYFFLATAFTLIELQSVEVFSRFCGSTWLSSSAVVSTAILTVLLANIIVAIASSFVLSNSKAIYLALTLFLVGNSFLSSNDLVHVFSLRAPAVIAVLQFIPAFLGCLIFSAKLKTDGDSTRALSASTFGAVFAAVVQFSKLFFGIHSLSLIAMALYLAAILTNLTAAREKQSDI